MNYLKILMFAAFAIPGAFANAECLQTSEKAAFDIARPEGNNPQSPLYASITASKLLKAMGNKLQYQVEIAFDINDGASSDSFPPETYLITAIGTAKSCKVIEVQLQK